MALFGKKKQEDPNIEELKDNTRGEVRVENDKPDPSYEKQRLKKIRNMKKKFDETVWSSVLDTMSKEIPQFVIPETDPDDPGTELMKYVLLGFDTKIVDDFANKSDDDVGSIMTAIKSSMDCVIENGLFDNELILMIPTKRTVDALAEFEETFDLNFYIAYATDDHAISLETKSENDESFITISMDELRKFMHSGERVQDLILRLQSRVGKDGDFDDDGIDVPIESESDAAGSNDDEDVMSEEEYADSYGSEEEIPEEEMSGPEDNADLERGEGEVKAAVSESVNSAKNMKNRVAETKEEIQSEVGSAVSGNTDVDAAADKDPGEPRGSAAGKSAMSKLNKLREAVQKASDDALNDESVKNAAANINPQARSQTFDMQAMDQYITRKYYSDDLGLEISSEPFDAMFMQSNPYVPFAEVDGDNWLSGYVNNLRRDANTRLSKLHQENLLIMRERFMLIITKHCEAIVKSVATDDPKTRFGYALKTITKIKSENLAGIQESAEAYKREKEAAFQARLQAEMTNASNIAKANFMNRYGKDHERELKEIETDLRNNIESEYVAAVENLKNERRSEAKRQLDAGISEALKICADEYTKMLAMERKEYTRLQSVITEFQNDNMSADEARIHTLSEEQRRSNEVAKVREEYDAKYDLATREFEAKLAAAKAEIEKAGMEHDRYIDTLKDQHEKLMQELRNSHNEQLSHKEREIEMLNEQLETAHTQIKVLTEKYANQDEVIGKKYEQQIGMLKSEREAWTERAEQVEHLHRYTDKVKLTGMAIAVAAALGIGVIVGCAVTAKINEKHGSQDITYHYIDQDGNEVNGAEVNFYDADTGEAIDLTDKLGNYTIEVENQADDNQTDTGNENK